MTRSVHICISGASGLVIIDRPGSRRETCCEVTEVPLDVAAHSIITKMNQIVFWPWPKRISWADIAAAKAGAFVKTETGR